MIIKKRREGVKEQEGIREIGPRKEEDEPVKYCSPRPISRAGSQVRSGSVRSGQVRWWQDGLLLVAAG